MTSLARTVFKLTVIGHFALVRPGVAQPAVNPAPDDRFKADILVIGAHHDDESLIAGYLGGLLLRDTGEWPSSSPRGETQDKIW